MVNQYGSSSVIISSVIITARRLFIDLFICTYFHICLNFHSKLLYLEGCFAKKMVLLPLPLFTVDRNSKTVRSTYLAIDVTCRFRELPADINPSLDHTQQSNYSPRNQELLLNTV